MTRVTHYQHTRLLIACTVVPSVPIREDWTRAMFEKLQDEFPDLLGTPLIVRDQFATFLRPAVGNAPPAQICQIAADNLLVGADPLRPGDQDVLPNLALRLFELARDTYHIQRIARVGRVEVAGCVLEAASEGASAIIRSTLTKLEPGEAADVELQFTRREGPYNINLKLSSASSSSIPGPTGLPVRDVLVTQSDVNNWDMSGDISQELAQAIVERGKRHARDEVPALLRERMGLDIREVNSQ